MIDICLNDGQTGYDVVGEYIRRYWKHNIYEVVICSIGRSYDGITYELINEVASPINFNDVEFLYDWWEGEKYIRLFGIKAVDQFCIRGGLYEE
jgi:hypothetical protein